MQMVHTHTRTISRILISPFSVSDQYICSMPTDHQGRFLTGVLSALWGRVPKPGLPSKRSFCTAMVQWCCFSANSTLHWLQGVNKQRCSCPNGILRHSPKGPKFHKDHERARVEKERICQSCFQSSQRSMLE